MGPRRADLRLGPILRRAEEVARRIVGPLRLTGTTTPDRETVLPAPHPRLYSTLHTPNGFEYDLTEQDYSALWASGHMVSRLDDLLIVLGALLDGRLLAPQVQEQLTNTVSTGADWVPDTRYGLGVHSHRLPGGATVWGHGGSVHGSWPAPGTVRACSSRTSTRTPSSSMG